MWSTKATQAKRHRIALSKTPNKMKKQRKSHTKGKKKISNPKKAEIIDQKIEKELRTDIADQISKYWPKIRYKRVLPKVVSVLGLKYFDPNDDEMKIKILDGIITEICDSVFKIKKTTNKHQKQISRNLNQNHFSFISTDTIYQIYSYFSGSDLISMLHLNKEHYDLLSHKNGAILWKKLCTMNEFTKHTEKEQKWKGLSWKQRFVNAHLRRENFVSFVRNTLQKKGFVTKLYFPTLSMDKIKQFENKYNCKLPKDYIFFINKLGNGGAGPSYGCPGILNNQTYENGNSCCNWNEWDRYKHLKYKYPYTDTVFTYGYRKVIKPDADNWYDRTTWIGYTDEEMKQNIYNATDISMRGEKNKNKIKRKQQGTICVSLNGCGYEKFLVVNGKDKGMVYDDGMCGDGGYVKIGGFLTWYEEWVEKLGDVKDRMSEICAPYWDMMLNGIEGDRK